MQCCYLFIYLVFSHMFIYGSRNFHSRCTRNEKSAPISGAGKWSRFMAPVSRSCVMALRPGTSPADHTVIIELSSSYHIDLFVSYPSGERSLKQL